ncbi:hypothetical protein [Erythrobacter sp. MTPC3]|uniref:hypothetical protein n=1 Tax=Erythrobacter sp. MTPC3 TaxID=3056564 RepID=UPI0036F330F1
MRKSHIYLAGIAVVTAGFVLGAPATAQEGAPPPGTAPIDEVSPSDTGAVPPEFQGEYDTWPPDQKAAYDMWPSSTQEYYWSLPPERQSLFWRLTDEDKISLTAMTGPERESAWESLEGRASGSGDAADEMPPPPPQR